MIKKLFKKFSHPIRGIMYALAHDAGFQFQIALCTTVLGIFIYLFRPFTQTESLFLGAAYFLVLITELQNSSFEQALDKLHPEIHDAIKRSKDMAAGAVLLSGFFLLFVMITIVLT